MKTLLNRKFPIAIEDVAHNSMNGDDAEVLAGSKLLMACGAEISWGSRNEDGRKIDMILSYDHPWVEGNERMLVLVQVKSGDSYGAICGDGFKLFGNAKLLAIRTSHAICVVWVSRKVHKAFWAYVHPSTEKGIQLYGKNHQISPATRFDLARCQAKYLPIKTGGDGIIMRSLLISLEVQRKQALEKYRSLKGQRIVVPNLGLLEFTRIGWRHMFRKGRSSKWKKSSIISINYIDKIIVENPSDTYVSLCKLSSDQGFEYRISEYVLIYDGVRFFEKDSRQPERVKFICRVLEEIRWPQNWVESSTLSQLTERRLIFLNCYFKQVN